LTTIIVSARSNSVTTPVVLVLSSVDCFQLTKAFKKKLRNVNLIF